MASVFICFLSDRLSRCETESQGKRIGNAAVDGQQDQRRDEITTLILTFFLLVFVAIVPWLLGGSVSWPILLMVRRPFSLPGILAAQPVTILLALPFDGGSRRIHHLIVVIVVVPVLLVGSWITSAPVLGVGVRRARRFVGFRIRLSQQERLKDEILAMGVLALDRLQSQSLLIVDDGRESRRAAAVVASHRGRRRRNGQVRWKLLQVRIASHHRNALLRP